MSFDIEDVGNLKQKHTDTIELPELAKAACINEIVQEHDLELALDLFGSDLIADSSNDNEIDIMTFRPKTVTSFKNYEKKILDFYQTVPDDLKGQFASLLIQKLVNPLSSYQLADILEKLPQEQ